MSYSEMSKEEMIQELERKHALIIELRQQLSLAREKGAEMFQKLQELQEQE